ncbi:hypothetical protein F5X68DRAFT_233828 [Plectosphaerella plurivora]|uniref:Ankyrin repeat protein n=1 Tax=Plectosphaerella plurivora TaxID=936078 RepID=A0A9P8V7F3_9PEZI|nr:hypothetical protein F5X68DRAFT_233828 [Plectosphaerella plurivora]
MAQDLPELPAPHEELARYIADHPDTPINDIIQPYRTYEAQLRSIFAQDRQSPLLQDPHVNLCPLFTNDTKDIKIRARDLESESQEEKDRYIMPLPEEKRRANGSPAVVASLADFRRNFSIFSESSLADLDWNNVVAAGSSVINTLLPVPPEFNTTKRKLREYYHEKFCPASDVDLFLYGLTHDEAIEKIKQIEKAIRDAILTEVTVVRTKYAITIVSQYPTRHVQIVLRVYKSIGEILTGFDIDAAGGAYDGQQVWVTPRALGSFITQINHIDLTRRSPSYENRLSKYSHRNFEVYWPDLDRSRVDPTIYERSFQRTLGLARLLVLERLPTSTVRDTYLSKRREERGRPALNRNYMHRLHGNIKDHHEDEVADWVNEQDVSNYHTFTVPYGAQFHAKKVEKLCYTRDLLLNAEWNQPKEREVYLHRHPAFFGRVEDVIEDCCGSCPKPVTPEEVEVAEKEAEIYISGKVAFLIDDPGRQQIGSFNPLTEDDWTDMAYVGNTARLCQSIVDGDVDEVLDWLSQEGADVNKRDYTGRTPLHLAVISSTAEVVRTLVEHGARLTARLADGMTALHLAAERGDSEMVKILMEKSEENENEEMEKQDRRRQAQQGKEQTDDKDHETDSESGESDGELIDGEETEADVISMATGSFVKVEKSDEAQADVDLDANTEEPDFYKSDVLSWDIPCSPLHLAIAQGHEDIVSLLNEFGSDALLPVKFLNSDKQPTGAILTLALALVLPLEKAQSMAKLLLQLGATSSQADFNGCTALHRYIQSGQDEMVDVLWANDKAAVKTAINHIVTDDRNYYDNRAMAPLHTAIEAGDAVLVLKLLEAGANPKIDFDSWLKAVKFTKMANRLGDYEANKKLFAKGVEQPVIFAAKNCPDPSVALELLERGADPNTITTASADLFGNEWSQRYTKGETLLDVVRDQISSLKKYKGETVKGKRIRRPDGMQEQLDKAPKGSYEYWITAEDIATREKDLKIQQENDEAEAKKRAVEQLGIDEKKAAINEIIEGFEKLEKAVLDKGGKSFYEIHPEINKPDRRYDNNTVDSVDSNVEEAAPVYHFDIVFKNVTDVTHIRKPAYLKLFEAAWSGDLKTIESLTLAAWGEKQEEPPLKMDVQDMNANSPFSLAFLRGHHDVAKAIIEIVKAQYSPVEKADERFKMEAGRDEDDDESYDSEDDSDDEPKIVSEIVNTKFTIDNIGQVSMQVKSHTRPTQVITAEARCFKTPEETSEGRQSLFTYTMKMDDRVGFKFLLDLAIEHAAEKLEGDKDDHEPYFTFPANDFEWAVVHGKLPFLSMIIKRTGAGMPLDHLVKKSGLALKDKPRTYQGLTVYGKKRKDWANAGRNLVVKSTGSQVPPLLTAARGGSIESVEWFLSDAPHRQYVEFGKSDAAGIDPRLKHLLSAPGGFERAVTKWLGNQNELALHFAVLGRPGKAANEVVEYLAEACPGSLEFKSTSGDTPLLLAFSSGRIDFAKTLIAAGADQSARNGRGDNIIHVVLEYEPKADRLRPMLELIDPELRMHLLLQRNNLQDAGATPLHAWVDRYCQTTRQRPNYYSAHASSAGYTYKYNNYESKEEGIAVLKLLLEYSKGGELEMLNGAGDTPLHSAVMAGNLDIVEGLLEFNPQLLYRENAVGRTASEVALGFVMSKKFKSPESIHGVTRHLHNFIGNILVQRSPEEYAKDKELSESKGISPWVRRSAKEHAQTTPYYRGYDNQRNEKNSAAVWEAIEAALGRHPGQRRLVSLNEANDVARRLGEKYNSARYFSMRPRNDDGDDEEKDSEDGNDGKPNDKEDFVAQQRFRRHAPWHPKIEQVDGKSVEEF